MNKRWSGVILLVVFLLAAVALTIVFRQVLREHVVLPLVEFWQNLQEFYHGLSPEMVWAAFLALAYFFTILSFPRLTSQIPMPFVPKEKERYQIFAEVRPDQEREGRLVFWVKEVGRLYIDRMQTRLSVLELKKLVLETVAYREGGGLREAELWLEENQKSVPPEVMGLLHVRPLPRADTGCNFLTRLWMRLQIWLRSVETPVEVPTEEKIAIILQYLEQHKEVKHDHRNI